MAKSERPVVMDKLSSSVWSLKGKVPLLVIGYPHKDSIYGKCYAQKIINYF